MLKILRDRLQEAVVDAPAGAAAVVAPAAALSSNPAPVVQSMDWLQSKYHVKDAAGKMDEAASIRKQAEAYGPLVKRLGSDELPPAAATDYKLTAPKEMDAAAFDEFVKDPETQAFLKEAHAAGYTQKQVEFGLNKWIARSQTLQQGQQQLTVDQTLTELKGVWKDEAAMKANMQGANKVAVALAAKIGVSYEDVEKAIGNNPIAIRILASLANEMGEDRPPHDPMQPTADLESLTKSEAYMNPSHKDHLATKQKVTEYFNRMPNANQKPRGPVTFSR